ncbi:MAG: GTP 3',8-cyclase MoaA [Candidatus Nitrosocosmicus sp.]
MEKDSIFNKNMDDSYGRIAKKLRISVTDRCNMRCVYCMPDKNNIWIEKDNILDFDQITHLVNIFASLGIEKIKITGGEPTVRPKLENLVKSLSHIKGIKSISMTTNGLLLEEKIKDLVDSGLNSINISLDTFDSKKFKSITGVKGGLVKVLDSIKMANSLGLKVKINTVIIRGWNDDEIIPFVNFARNTGNIVKFIEFMPLDGTGIWNHNLVFSKREIIEIIESKINKLLPTFNDKSDPARLYSFEDNIGIVGFIPSITEPFCQYCDRVRITAEGKFYTCLFDKKGYDLKKLIQECRSDEQIKKYILETVRKKPEGIISIIKSNSLKPTLNVMNSIGG